MVHLYGLMESALLASCNSTFPLALTAEALLSEICQNWRFLKGLVTLSADFR